MNNRLLPLSCLLMVTAAVALVAGRADAATYCGGRFEGKTVRWIVPSAPGGGYDTYSRLVAPFYGKYTGARVVVQNRPGAGGGIGARQIMRAAPDGLTVGILNGPGLIMAAYFETPAPPNPATDFTILARVVKDRQLWAIARNSRLPGVKSLVEKRQSRPIVFGTRGPGTLSFADMVIASHILHLRSRIVTGYRGSRDDILAVLRGEVDAVAHSNGSLLAAFRSGELRPWLQITDGPVSDDSRYAGVPWLAGPQGLAVQAARRDGRDVVRASRQAAALVTLTGAGRLIAAPPGLDAGLTRCLRAAVHAALSDPGFVEAAATAGRALDVAGGEKAAARLESVQPDVAAFVPVLKRAAALYDK